MYSGYPFKYAPQTNPSNFNNFTESNYRPMSNHHRINSYDPNRPSNIPQTFNTPPKPRILQKSTKDTAEFLSDTKLLRNKFEEKNRLNLQPQQLLNEIDDYLENKKKIEQMKMKPPNFPYTAKYNNSNIGKMGKTDSSPKSKANIVKAPNDLFTSPFDTFPKNQNLKHFLDQKINKEKLEDVRITAQFGSIDLKNKSPELVPRIENSSKPSIGFQHKRIASSGFEGFKHQENIDRHLLADNKLYFDESPVYKDNRNMFDGSTIRFSYRTRKGYMLNNPYKVNQDNFITHSFMLNQSTYHIFAICDGHGVFGHLVSYFIKQEFPNILRINPTLETNPEKALFNSIKLLESLLEKSSINLEMSGSTFIVILLKGNKLYCANVGDSRAIISQRTPSFFSKWEHIPLSIDHKPDLPKEAERINKTGGRVGSIQDYTGKLRGPKRVWLQKEDAPGLAMSRSIGDLMAKSIGVTWEPEIKDQIIDSKHKFIVIGSDGLWEFLGNEECTNIVGLFYLKNDLEGACEYLLNEAYQRWIKNEENSIDDITFIIIFLQSP